MKLRSLLVSVAMVLSSAASMAYTQDLGTLSPSGNTFSAAFVRFFGLGSPLGDFTDYYTFQMPGSGDAHGTILSFDLGFVDLALKSVSLYPTGNPGGAVVDTTVDQFSFGDLLANTSYTLAVSGSLKTSVLDIGAAFYQGTIRSIASPAPEPTAIALAVAGLFGVLALSRGRKS